MVHPASQRQGIGAQFLQAIEKQCPSASRFELFTGSKSTDNIRLYQCAGYRITTTQPLSPAVQLVFLEKSAAKLCSG